MAGNRESVLKNLLLLLVALTAATGARADFGDYRSHDVSGNRLTVRSELGELHVTAIGNAAFEIHYVENDVRQLPSFALASGVHEHPAELVHEESDAAVAVTVDGLTAVVAKHPVRVSFLHDGQPLLAEEHGYYAHETVRGFRFQLEAHEKILGGGQRVLGMDRRGRRMPLYNRAHYGYTLESDQMYYSLPAVMSNDRYMIVFDNSARGWLDIGHTEPDVLSFEAVAGRTAYIVVAGDSYPDLVSNYTGVTGTQPLPPRWAFGNFASRFGYRSEEEARDVVSRFRRYDIPLDTLILDIYWFGPDIKGHMGNLDWDRNSFPDPERMIADFAADGVKTIAVTEPFVLSTSKRWDDAVENDVLARNVTGVPRRFDFYFGNTGLIDVFDDNARDWFWQPYRMLFDQGLAGTWGDLGEPEVHPADALHRLSEAGIVATGDEVHNAYGHEWARMVYEKQVTAYPEVRPVIMMRSGFAGSQRYGMIPWTGDVSREWDGLKPQVELALQMGLFGLGYTHSDLGGFAGGEKFDREMYLRWLQYGVFQPIYRPHAQDHIAAEPVFHDRTTRRIARDFIRLRYQLLPYIYTLAFENSTQGLPLMRPLFFDNEDDLSLIDENQTFLWGDAFLVRPVLEAGARSVEMRLPGGAWFDFWNGTRYDGESATVPVTIETTPVLVRAGAFVPMAEPVNSTDDYSSERLALHYYADATVSTSSGQMFEDDGRTRGTIASGNYELLTFDAHRDGDYLRIDLARTGQYPGMPDSRDLKLVIHNWSGPVDALRFGGQSVDGKLEDGTLTVFVRWSHDSMALEVNERPAATDGGKPVVYQVFTRLFGNTTATNTPWGTLEQNGVGKFADIDDAALQGIRELGTTHVWYTGVPHHAVIRDYTAYGIDNDDPDVVKGRAGSPYAVRDYYNVNPDLAVDPARRLEEFDALIERTHDNGMQVVIDIVPNHVARAYRSISAPDGVVDFGADDDSTVEWRRDNNFYYISGQDFAVPEGYVPLNGELHPLADGKFDESPAKWTGNGSRDARPKTDDWFETVKINFGVRPDGSKAFDELPPEARDWSYEQHAAFWSQRDVPDSWAKFRDIAHFWLDRGVDGFRYDMAQMVPVEFWSYLNSSIKVRRPDAFLLSEIYVPELYRDYIQLGRMDYLYDKVGLYDTVRAVIEGRQPADTIAETVARVLDIDGHMLHFLENHDEHRIASEQFAGNAKAGMPAMTVSALIGRGPTMIYFGQEVGEPADGVAGFGDASRTSIFDYWGVPAHQRWMNGGAFDGGALSDDERALRDFYRRLLTFSADNTALRGQYAPLPVNHDRIAAFARWKDGERLLVISNFSAAAEALMIDIPPQLTDALGLAAGRHELVEQLYGERHNAVTVDHGVGRLHVELQPNESVVYRVGGGMFKAPDNAPFLADASGAAVAGQLVYWFDFPSQVLEHARHVAVWLPPGYAENTDRRYPVIYMSDGENLFDPRIASWGVDWGIDEAMNAGVAAGEFGPAIVVGAWSSPRRGYEYSPWHGAPDYARFLIEELMPRVNAEFRTRSGPDNTFVMGASMGGLLAYYLVARHPDVFGACGCVSSHFALSDVDMIPGDDGDPTPYILRDIANGDSVPEGVRLFFDYGTETLDSTYESDHAPVHEWLVEQGLLEGRDFRIQKYAGADHSERAWRERVGDQLRWLLGGR